MAIQKNTNRIPVNAAITVLFGSGSAKRSTSVIRMLTVTTSTIRGLVTRTIVGVVAELAALNSVGHCSL